MIEDVVEQLFQEIVSHSNKRMPDTSATRKMHLSIRKLLMDTISVSAQTKLQHWASIQRAITRKKKTCLTCLRRSLNRP